MGEVLSKAGALVLIIAIGYVIRRRRWVDASSVGLFAKILINVTLPAAIVTSFNTVQVRPSMLLVAVIGFVAVILGQVVGFVACRSDGRPAQALAILNVGPFNAGLFALPFLSTVVGPEAIVIVGLFDLGNALAAIVLGFAWAQFLVGDPAQVRPGRQIARALLMPVFLSYVGMVVVRLAGLTVPAPIISLTSIIGAANSFLAMLMIGIGLEIVLDRRRYGAAARILGLRYAVGIVAGLIVWFVLPLAPLERAVVVMTIAAPIASLSAAFTAETKLDVGVSTFAISVSVLVSIVVMPLLSLVTL